MTPAAHAQAIIELLEQFHESTIPADRIINRYFKSRKYAGGKDKRVIIDCFYELLRHFGAYSNVFDNRLEDESAQTSARLLFAAFCIAKETALSTAFTGEKFAPKKLAEKENKLLNNIKIDDISKAISNLELVVPSWMLPLYRSSLGDKYSSELQTLLEQAPIDLRVNTVKSSRKQLAYNFKQLGIETEESNYSPWGLRLTKRAVLPQTDAFKQGWFEVQDEGSQLLALATQVQPGDTVFDFCAGGGGKTLAMAAMMQNKGRIIACDVHQTRLQQLRKRCARNGVDNVQIHALKNEDDSWLKRHREKADVVLIDAPCSGSGTWRRNPDSRWRLSRKRFEELLATQQRILNSASRLVKPGGLLVYATCSLFEQENSMQVSEFLSKNQMFKVDRSSNITPVDLPTSRFVIGDGSMQTLVSISQTDAFFVQRFKRIEGVG